MKEKVKMKYIIIVVLSIVILSIVLGGVIISKIEKNDEKRKNKDPRECVERKLDIELGEEIVLVEGKAYDDEVGEEEHIKAKFSVAEQALEKLERELEEALGEYDLAEIEEVCNFKRDDIWLDLKEKEILKFYNQFREGNKAKTIIITAFIATDSTGEYYFYIFY